MNRHTWSLDVTDDAARGVVHELDADLGDTTTGAYIESIEVSNCLIVFLLHHVSMSRFLHQTVFLPPKTFLRPGISSY